MCAINPTHKKVFKLEVYVFNPGMSLQEFLSEAYTRVLKAEQELNKDCVLRFHVCEVANDREERNV